MKILYLASASSIHTTRWVNEMTRRNHEVHLVSMQPVCDPLEEQVRLYQATIPASIGYYANFPWVRQIARRISPDVLHAHYASGYGTLARLVNFHPTVLSVWGSDIFDFPNQASWKKSIIKKNLDFADQIVSTSRVMKTQVRRMCLPKREIEVIPFGVDCNVFFPRPKPPGDHLRIGTVKTLSPIYGMSTLIEAFAILKRSIHAPVELILVGDGPQKKELEALAVKLNVREAVKFVGSVPHSEIPKWLNSFHVYAGLSVFESFGVSVIEASACGLPVVVSNAGGLPEVVRNNETGFIVPARDARAAAEKIVQLAGDSDLCNRMGRNGREFVLKNYEWYENADRMEKLYCGHGNNGIRLNRVKFVRGNGGSR